MSERGQMAAKQSATTASSMATQLELRSELASESTSRIPRALATVTAGWVSDNPKVVRASILACRTAVTSSSSPQRQRHQNDADVALLDDLAQSGEEANRVRIGEGVRQLLGQHDTDRLGSAAAQLPSGGQPGVEAEFVGLAQDPGLGPRTAVRPVVRVGHSGDRDY